MADEEAEVFRGRRRCSGEPEVAHGSKGAMAVVKTHGLQREAPEVASSVGEAEVALDLGKALAVLVMVADGRATSRASVCILAVVDNRAGVAAAASAVNKEQDHGQEGEKQTTARPKEVLAGTAKVAAALEAEADLAEAQEGEVWEKFSGALAEMILGRNLRLGRALGQRTEPHSSTQVLESDK